MGSRGLTLVAVLAAVLAWALSRRPARVLPGPLAAASQDFRRGLEQDAIRWSGHFLHSMGAVDSARRAERDAMLAQRVAGAVMDRLADAVREIKVVIIGGVIHLEGDVASHEARAEAERVAREVSGAQVIADDLRVG